jgi:hypothetical protein
VDKLSHDGAFSFIGDDMASRRFTDEQEEKIKERYLAGESERGLARSLGVSRDCIHGALSRQRTKRRTPAERNRLYSVNGNAFDVIDTEHKAYFLGLLYADGSVYKRSLCFSQKERDEILVKRLKAFLQSGHPIKKTMAKCNGKEYPQRRIFVTDEHLVDRLRELGIVAHRPTHKETVRQIPTELHRHFIRGFFDGDGSAYTKPGLSFVGRLPFVEWIHRTIGTTNGRNINKHTISHVYYLKYGSKQNSSLVESKRACRFRKALFSSWWDKSVTLSPTRIVILLTTNA